jgi:hypothetical protein
MILKRMCIWLVAGNGSNNRTVLEDAINTTPHGNQRLHGNGSNNRTVLEDAINTTPHGNQRLHVQWRRAPDDGHSSVRNMKSNVECNKKCMILKQMCVCWVFIQLYYLMFSVAAGVCLLIPITFVCKSCLKHFSF